MFISLFSPRFLGREVKWGREYNDIILLEISVLVVGSSI